MLSWQDEYKIDMAVSKVRDAMLNCKYNPLIKNLELEVEKLKMENQEIQMKKIINVCDKCGKTWTDNPRQIFNISVKSPF